MVSQLACFFFSLRASCLPLEMSRACRFVCLYVVPAYPGDTVQVILWFCFATKTRTTDMPLDNLTGIILFVSLFVLGTM